MALPTGAESSGGRIIDKDGIALVRVDDRKQITASTSDGAGNLLTYTELLADGTSLHWTLTYNADGSIATQTYT